MGWRSGIVGAALVATAGGCTVDPAAPLIPTPPRPSTIAPWQAPARTADGFPNILADPVVVNGGLPRPQRLVDAEVDGLAARRQRSEAATARIPRTNFAAELSRRATSSVREARAAIAASGRPATGRLPPDPTAAIDEARRTIAASGSRPAGSSATAPEATPAPVKAPVEPADAARPIDPAAPLPRAVGPTP